ncbi:hypothetical protein [Aquimarina longa]|uniref:hypothetical protein n=1 Tax=Aquimarina longa TaxID=1080221 RepID=UPI00078651FA|nr:hypothetical protein [Aquimarina longa]
MVIKIYIKIILLFLILTSCVTTSQTLQITNNKSKLPLKLVIIGEKKGATIGYLYFPQLITIRNPNTYDITQIETLLGNQGAKGTSFIQYHLKTFDKEIINFEQNFKVIRNSTKIIDIYTGYRISLDNLDLSLIISNAKKQGVFDSQYTVYDIRLNQKIKSFIRSKITDDIKGKIWFKYYDSKNERKYNIDISPIFI